MTLISTSTHILNDVNDKFYKTLETDNIEIAKQFHADSHPVNVSKSSAALYEHGKDVASGHEKLEFPLSSA